MEFHDTGLSKSDYYRMAVHEVNAEYDRKQEKRSFLSSKSSIEQDREKALKAVKDRFYSGGGGGGRMTE